MLDPAQFTTVALPTAADVRAKVNMRDGKATAIAVLEILDWQRNPKTILPDGTNDITDYLLGLTFYKNASEDVMGSADIRLHGDAGQYIDPFADWLQLSAVYVDDDGNRISGKIPAGIYLYGILDRDVYDRGFFYTGKVFDEGFVLTQLPFANDFVPPRGLAYTTLWQAMLRMDYRTPSEGGRQPSGIAWSTSPQGTAPAPGGYAQTGVLASSVCTLNPTTGYLDSPAGPLGVISYNPYDTRVRCDPATYAPISPMTGTPMRLATAASPTTLTSFYDAALNLYFRSPTGEFLQQLTTASYLVVDPFKRPLAAYPTGSFVKQPNPLGGGGVFGTYTPPMSTWPDDFDGSGPYFQGTTASIMTVPISAPAPVAGPSSAQLGSPTLAGRYGNGTIVLLPAGSYLLGATTSATDPAHPATQWTETTVASGTGGMDLAAGNWSLPSEAWTVTAQFTGLPHPAGSISITCDVYHVAGGTPTHLATLASSGTETFDGSYQGGLTAICSGTVPAVSCGAGDSLRFHIVASCSALTGTISNADGEFSAGISANCSVQFGAAVQVGAGGSFLDPGQPAQTLSPANGPTGVPFPDIADAAICPSGCETWGPNIPPSRIAIPDLPDTLPVATPFNRKSTWMAAMKQMTETTNCTPLGPDEVGTWVTKRKPYYINADVPTPVWSFSNLYPAPDGKIIAPIAQRIIDQSGIANVVLFVSEPNGKGQVVWSKRTNDGNNSVVSRSHMHRTIGNVIQDDNVLSQDAADATADLGIQTGAEGTESLAFAIPFNPCLSLFDAITVHVENPDTGEVYIDGAGNPYFITSIESQVLSNGEPTGVTKLTCERIVTF